MHFYSRALASGKAEAKVIKHGGHELCSSIGLRSWIKLREIDETNAWMASCSEADVEGILCRETASSRCTHSRTISAVNSVNVERDKDVISESVENIIKLARCRGLGEIFEPDDAASLVVVEKDRFE